MVVALEREPDRNFLCLPSVCALPFYGQLSSLHYLSALGPSAGLQEWVMALVAMYRGRTVTFQGIQVWGTAGNAIVEGTGNEVLAILEEEPWEVR